MKRRKTSPQSGLIASRVGSILMFVKSMFRSSSAHGIGTNDGLRANSSFLAS